MMKFVLEVLCNHSSDGGGRLGIVSCLRSSPSSNYSTPMMIISTQTGSVPHITQEVYQFLLSHSKQYEQEQQATHTVASTLLPLQPSPLLSASMQHFAGRIETLDKFGKGCAAFAGMKECGVISSLQCSLTETPSGYNDKKSVSTWTHIGRLPLQPQQYLKVASSMHCDMHEALHDCDTPQGCPSSRVLKSFNSSFQHLSYAMKHVSSFPRAGKLLVPLLGGWQTEHRTRWIRSLKTIVAAPKESKDPKNSIESNGIDPCVAGYTLKGLHASGLTAENIEPDDALTNCLRASLSGTVDELVHVALGAYSPHTLLSLVAEGFDVFDSSLATLVANRSAALTFAYTQQMLDRMQTSDTESSCKLKNVSYEWVDPGNVGRFKRRKTDEGAVALEEDEDTNGSDRDTMIQTEKPYEINLKDKRHSGSVDVLLEGCLCYTCSKGFTRGYLHHLCDSHEMLVPLLLSMHNFHHYLGFFSSVRSAIATKSLDQLRSIVLQSYRPAVVITSPTTTTTMDTSTSNTTNTKNTTTSTDKSITTTIASSIISTDSFTNSANAIDTLNN